ncbi:unnamed protein product [marine sediment metagenome]|uniref:Uncharacterized protein n=1 Tax=marine sediment metagenome TaxID=412755 RepID=X1TDD2_9ZZZZ
MPSGEKSQTIASRIIEDLEEEGDGSYGFYNVPVGEHKYTFEVRFPGDATYGFSYASKSCTYAKVGTNISISVSPKSGGPPMTVTTSGKLTRIDTGAGLSRMLNLYKDGVLIDSQRSSMEPATLGKYEFTDVITVMGTYTYYVEWGGDDWFSGCEETILPCPACGYSSNIQEMDREVTCLFCGAVSEVVPILG